MPPERRIFISYRRADVGAELVIQLATYLRTHVTNVDVFVDQGGVGIGTYPSQLEAALVSSHIVLAVIGQSWRGASDTAIRLDDPADWVRRELQIALRADKIVVPVLVDVELPAVDLLPLSLRPLCEYQAYRIDTARFNDGVGRLAGAIAAAELAPTLRRRDAEEAAYRELTDLVARLNQLVLEHAFDVPQLIIAAEQFWRSADHNGDEPVDDARRRVLIAAQRVLEVLATVTPEVFQYAAFRPNAAVVGGMARTVIDAALRGGTAGSYDFENARRALLALRELVSSGVTSYTSRYRGEGGDVALPPGTRVLVAARTASTTGIAVFGTIDGRAFTRVGLYEARARPLHRVQLRAARNQEPKLYAFDDRSVYRWRLESTVPEVEWPIPDDDLEHKLEQLHVFQGERIEFLAGEGSNGRRWLKWVGRPDLVELPTRTLGIGGTFRDDGLAPFGVAATGKDHLVLEQLGGPLAVQWGDVSIDKALAMRPELFVLGGPPLRVYPPHFTDLAKYRGFRCALADCALAPAGDALLFLDAERGTWLRTPIVHRAFRGSAQLIEVGDRWYLVRATADRDAAAVVWDVSNPLDLGAPPIVARWTSQDHGARVVAARSSSQTLVICSSMTPDGETAGFAVLSLGEHPPRFFPVELDGATYELSSAVPLDASARTEIARPPAPPADRYYKYKAFLSYSHAADGALAPRLQSMLQQFAKPWYRLRAFRVFRDKTGLGVTATLWPAIEQALENAEFFVLLASPEAAASTWVKREVAWWLQHRAPARILIAWTAGELVWRADARDFDGSRSTALPDELRGVFEYEPLYLDLRWAKRRTDASPRRGELLDATARLASTLRDQPLDDLIGEDVRQHRKFRLFSAGAALAVLAFAIVATWQAFVARHEANVAASQTAIAEREASIARSRALAAQSGEALSRDLGDALTLAIQAHRERATEEANAALVRVLSGPRLRRVVVHPRPVVHLDISGGEPRVVLSLTDDGVVRLWDVAEGRPLGAFGHGITYAAFSPDGATIAAAGADGGVQLWSRAPLHAGASLQAGGAGEATDEDPPADHRIASLAWSRDGKWLAGPDRYGWLNLWNTADAKRVAFFEVFDEFAASVAFAPDGRVLAFSGARDTAELRDVANGKRVVSVGVHHDAANMWNGNGASTDGVSAAALSADGSHVLFGTEQGRLELWKIGAKTSELSLRGFANSVTDVGFTREGLVAAGFDGTARVWAGDGEPRAIMVGHTGRIRRALISPNAHVLLTISIDGTARTWNLDTGFPIAVLVGHGMPVTSAVFVDDLHVWTSGEDGTVRAWDLGNAQNALLLGEAPDTRVAFSSDGSHIVVIRTNHRAIQVYDRAGRAVATLAPRAAMWKRVAVAPDAARAAIASDAGAIEVWDIATHTLAFPPLDGGADVEAVAFSPDGRAVVVAHANATLSAVDASSGAPVGAIAVADSALAEPGEMFFAFARRLENAVAGRVRGIGPGTSIALVERNDEMVVAYPDKRHADVKLAVPPQVSWVIAFSPDGARLAVAERGGRVRVFDTRDGRPLATLAGNPSDVTALEFSRDGGRLVMLCDNGSIRVSDAATGRGVTSLAGLGKPTSAHLSPDGKQLLTGGSDEPARVFTLDPEELARIGDQLLPATTRARD